MGTALALAVGVLAGVAPVASADPSDPVFIPDTNLRACINSALGQPSGAPVTSAQAQTLTYLNCENTGIANITGLEAFTGLTQLYLALCQISDVSPLGALPSLTSLDLYSNQISTVSPLGTLTNLTYLDLSGNQVSNVSTLGTLTNLAYLDLSDNQVSNVSTLGTLTNLNILSLAVNQVSSVSPLGTLTNLTYLELAVNQVGDVSPLGALTNLTYLSLDANRVSDVSPLGGLTGLTHLGIHSNRVTDASPLSSLTGDVDLSYQSVVLPSGIVGTAYPLPVVTNRDGSHPVLSVSGGGYVINELAGTITFSGSGSYQLTWNTGGVRPFSGTMTVAVVAAEPITIGSVTVSGGSSVGSVLTASVVGVSVSGGTVTYQWLRAGQPIAGATQSTYKLTTKDMCSQISVQVTVSKPGYITASKVSASKTGPVFTDVPASHTFYSPICWVAQTGVTVGTGAGMYSPSDPVNRGSMAAFLYRMAGSPTWTPPVTSPFTDVPKSHKFYKEITWLAASGITVGVVIGGKTYYQPDNAVNRGSMSALMYRLSGSPSYTAPATAKFADVATTHTFYKTISWLASKNITAGTMVGGQLLYQPSNPVSRGSMAAFLNRLANQHLQCTRYPSGIECPIFVL
jgi:hypothetical protein